MNVQAWHLPWGKRSVPHAVLDIIRGCNITCNACYNLSPPCTKSLVQIEQDLDCLMKRRQLTSLSIVGGEPLLHPNLCEIIRRVKARGLHVELCTNGVLLDSRKLHELQAAGLDVVFLHIERGQQRSDMPTHPTREQLCALWEEKTILVGSHGLDVGLTMTASSDRLGEVKDIILFTLQSPHVNYLLVTLHRDVGSIDFIMGDLDSGMQGRHQKPLEQREDTLNTQIIWDYLSADLKLRPFAYLGSNVSLENVRWLSYLVGSVTAGQTAYHSLRASSFEKLFLFMSWIFGGRYPMYRKQSSVALLIELLLNGLTGGDLAGNLSFFMKAIKARKSTRTKRLLFQCPAEVGSDGRIIHCMNCPDAVVRKGKLVPVCISDRVRS
ncbi:MAG: hypothetical protein A2X46_06515 [Lentisphaerae bacterium GWF2_57_35]|nr:MAG: hypothetical protein A2X46_06515 [Lentisphaerae bacterium GWF2_57_35]